MTMELWFTDMKQSTFKWELASCHSFLGFVQLVVCFEVSGKVGAFYYSKNDNLITKNGPGNFLIWNYTVQYLRKIMSWPEYFVLG